jgi:hypothetical protein
MSPKTIHDEELYPSTLFVFWPGREPPPQAEVRLNAGAMAERLRDYDPADWDLEEALWSDSYGIEDYPAPLLTWAGRSEGLVSERDFGQACWNSGEEQRARESAWVVGVETLLCPRHPAATYQRQLQFGLTLCPGTPAVYDACSYKLRAGSEVQRLTSTDVPPRTTTLFSIHAIGPDEVPAPPDHGHWLHTHGLNRANCPELELLDVPQELIYPASCLINGLADLLIDLELPPPGSPFRAGQDLWIAWRPWEKVVRERPRTALGGRDDREDEAHQGYRIVLVDPQPRGRRRKRWGPPLKALRRLNEDHSVLFITARETERMARLARERWPEFGMLFARHKRDGWEFLVKLGYVVDGGEPHEREHLWFEVKEIVPDRVRAVLLNAPYYIERMRAGQEDWHGLDHLTDWSISTPLGTFNPETAEYLWDAAAPDAKGSEEQGSSSR